MTRKSLWSQLIAAGLLAISIQPCLGQWYQGPSGGLGGSPFDHWKLSNSSTNITKVSFRITDGSLHCISVAYGTGPSPQRVHAGNCDLGPDPAWRFGEIQGLDLAADEYIIGISGVRWSRKVGAHPCLSRHRSKSAPVLSRRLTLPSSGLAFGQPLKSNVRSFTRPT